MSRIGNQSVAASLVVELDGNVFEATLLDELAPITCRAVRAMRPIRGDVYHAMWSGPICLMNFDLSGAPLENATTFLSPGDLLYHPVHKEIGIAYGATQFREPTGAAYTTLIGRLRGDLAPLVETGSRLQRIGARPLLIR
jgi:hypothetical protein